jgi:von Willebrand factor type A domain
MGMSYLRSEDYPGARLALQEAVNGDPNNAQWVYGLALALLNGKDKDEYRGYWYLARAANLTGQMPQGREIAEYARNKYRSGGGKEAGWQAFVASAAALDAPPPPAGSSESTTVVAANTGNSTVSTKNAGRSSSSSGESSGNTKLETASLSKPSKGKSSFGFEDTLREPDHGPSSSSRRASGPKAIAAPSEAVSLGILIETSLLTGHNRSAIISTLKDIVKNLRNRDEACILVFSDQLDFEQDLTADDRLLEEALAEMRPRPGKALLSGISFAAGHLKRIGKNNNRVLLIISDGASHAEAADTIAFRSQVSGVRIDCIGLKTASDGRALLERISAYSGGKAAFASNVDEFRSATLEMTRNMGIMVQ